MCATRLHNPGFYHFWYFPYLSCLYFVLLFPCRLIEPWQYFIARYSIQHHDWVDHHLCEQCFSGLEPVHLHPTRGNDAIAIHVKRESIDKTAAAGVAQEVSVVILFTGLSTSVVKKYRQVRGRKGDTLLD